MMNSIVSIDDSINRIIPANKKYTSKNSIVLQMNIIEKTMPVELHKTLTPLISGCFKMVIIDVKILASENTIL